jgi:hypothetical protein
MFKRVYTHVTKSGKSIILLTQVFDDEKSMESSQFSGKFTMENGELTVEEYEDYKLLRSYEYFNTDRIRSTEGALNTQEEFNGIIVDIHTRDEHGYMNRYRRLLDKESPAHVHIGLNKASNVIGELNITGPCPTSKNDVLEYKAASNIRSRDFNDHKKDIVSWANSHTAKGTTDEKTNNWQRAQKYWLEINGIDKLRE